MLPLKVTRENFSAFQVKHSQIGLSLRLLGQHAIARELEAKF